METICFCIDPADTCSYLSYLYPQIVYHKPAHIAYDHSHVDDAGGQYAAYDVQAVRSKGGHDIGGYNTDNGHDSDHDSGSNGFPIECH